MRVKQTGLLHRVQARLTLNQPVSTEETIEMLQIINYNAKQLAKLEKRVSALENPKPEPEPKEAICKVITFPAKYGCSTSELLKAVLH